ncbi:MAG: DUF2520 domain-containing protein [Bacteroidetes bacterium]|nr:DUF2520 domain-containing protein [Bacteroidota bacterium]
MQKQAKHKIVIIGCGNVAWHLAKLFSSLKKHELFVYNHKPNDLLNDFKTKLKCKTQVGLDKIITNAEFYFICVSDRSISSASIHIKTKNGILIHTSGSVKLDELGSGDNTAVFYPLQTFSKQDEINWQETPIIIEAKNTTTKTKVTVLAKQVSNNVGNMTYKDRLRLHLAAVFVNNFTNALFVSAGDIVNDKQLKNLLPLIKQTITKLGRIDPRAAQTGPAKRGDEAVMKKHLKLLSGNADLKKIYKQMSSLIIKQQNNKHA